MKNRNWLFTALISLFSGLAMAQSPDRCYTELHDQELQARFPGQAAHRARMELQIQQYLNQQTTNQKTNGAVIKIPVVIHVVSEKGCNSISKAQILNGLEVVNQDFRRQNPDTVNTRAIFKPYVADTEIEFVLARKDPQGNPTDGINRITSPLAIVPLNRDDMKKAVPAWPTNKYFNIWLVDSIVNPVSGSSVLGYSQFPGVGLPWNTYGVVMLHNRWGKQGAVAGSTAVTNGHEPTHEIGHCFHLLHDFPGANSNRSCAGDLVADTPPYSGAGINGNCDFSRNTCSNDVQCSAYTSDVPDQIENFMYIGNSDCMNMFTLGQKMRMQATINTIPQLQDLVSGVNALQTGIDPNASVGPLVAKPYFCADARRICAGSSVTFSDLSYQGTATSRSWSFAGGTPATSTAQNPVITYNTPGKYAVTLTFYDGSNAYPATITNYIEVVAVSNLINVSPPNYYVESFEETTFPESATANRTWELKTSLVDANPQNWTRTMGVASSLSPHGTSSLALNSGSLPNGTVSTLISPNFTTNGSNPSVVFLEMAYAKRVAQPKDELRVYTSEDCGVTWSAPLLTLTGNQLVTNGGAIVPGNFVPTASEWQRLGIVSGGNPFISFTPHSMFKIEMVSNGGGTLYIDNFTIGSILGTNEALANQHKIKVYPNPVTSETNLEFELKTPEKVCVKILDILGNTIYSSPEATFSAGKHSVLLAGKLKNQSKGLYLVQLHTGGKIFNTKLLLQ